MPVFDQLQRASFDGIEFMVKSVHITCKGRKHVHEYLRVEAGVIEKLKRGLYQIEMEADFQATMKGFGVAWPNNLAALRDKFEREVDSTLVIPTIGSIPAMLEDWDQTAEMGRIRSGERARLPFIEYANDRILAGALVQVDVSSVAASTTNLAAIRAELELSAASESIFDSIQDAANAILSIKDQADLYGNLIGAKVAQMTGLIREADRQVTELQDPEFFELLYALQDLHDAAITLAKNMIERPNGPRIYTTPRVMTVSEIAVAVYGSTARANDIMLNNELDDPFAVRAGTNILYMQAA